MKAAQGQPKATVLRDAGEYHRLGNVPKKSALDPCEMEKAACLKHPLKTATSSVNAEKGELRSLTSASASVTSSVPWVRSFGFFHVFGAVTAVEAARQACIH